MSQNPGAASAINTPPTIAERPTVNPVSAVEKTIAGDPFLKGKAGGLVWLADRKGK